MNKPEEFLFFSSVGLFIFFTIALLSTLVSTAFFLASGVVVFIAVIYKVIEQKEEKAMKRKDNLEAQSVNSIFKMIFHALLSSFSIWALIIFAIIAFFAYYSPDALASLRDIVFVLMGTILIGWSFIREDIRWETWESFGVAFIIMGIIWWLLFSYNGTPFEKCIYDYKSYGPEAVDEHCDKFLL